MSQTIITKMYDRIDKICFAYYGSTDNREDEIVLDANPGLEQQPILLPAGLSIFLPDIVLPSIKAIRQIKLWE